MRLELFNQAVEESNGLEKWGASLWNFVCTVVCMGKGDCLFG